MTPVKHVFSFHRLICLIKTEFAQKKWQRLCHHCRCKDLFNIKLKIKFQGLNYNFGISWNEGKNHLIFNILPGSEPVLEVDVGYAMVNFFFRLFEF